MRLCWRNVFTIKNQRDLNVYARFGWNFNYITSISGHWYFSLILRDTVIFWNFQHVEYSKKNVKEYNERRLLYWPRSNYVFIDVIATLYKVFWYWYLKTKIQLHVYLLNSPRLWTLFLSEFFFSKEFNRLNKITVKFG